MNPLTFIAGCNTPADVTRHQLTENIKLDVPWLEQQPLKNEPLTIVGGGASLKDMWMHIDFSTDIMALNNSYSFLLERGIEPDYFMLLDAREDNVEFLRSPCQETMHLIAAQCHPTIFKRLDGYRTTLYLTTLPDTLELVDSIDKPKVQIAGTVGTVGIKALCMAYALGYRELHLFGYDSSYRNGEHHAFSQTLNDGVGTIEVFLNGEEYVTTPTMAHQATEFCQLARGMVRHYDFDINLHCSGLLPDMVAYSNKLGETPLEIREREKYEQVWTHDVYRKSAPGENMVDDAINRLNLSGTESIIDFGCGTGRASAKLLSLGYKVTSVDHAANCVDAGLHLNFIQACLWDMPEIQAEVGYCTDVMEHIPSEKVHDVLKTIAAYTKSAYFNIATRDDCLGSLVGKKLHMTVIPASDWEQLLKTYWCDVKCLEGEGEATFIVSRPKESSAS